jgi:hypothetical protein
MSADMPGLKPNWRGEVEKEPSQVSKMHHSKTLELEQLVCSYLNWSGLSLAWELTAEHNLSRHADIVPPRLYMYFLSDDPLPYLTTPTSEQHQRVRVARRWLARHGRSRAGAKGTLDALASTYRAWSNYCINYAYDCQPASSKRNWVKVGVLPTGRTRCACTVLSSGAVIVAGGSTSIDSSPSQTVEVAEWWQDRDSR